MTSDTQGFVPQKLHQKSRSLGLKLIVILILIVLMAIPVMFISFISFDRSSRANEVTREVSQTYGGEQRLIGPLLTIPYRETLANGGLREGDYIISAQSGAALFQDVTVEEKSRSLYKVPIYTAKGSLSAEFTSLTEIEVGAGPELDFTQAQIILGMADVTGLQSDVVLEANGETRPFEPYLAAPRFMGKPRTDRAEAVRDGGAKAPPILYDHLDPSGVTWLSVPAPVELNDAMTSVSVRLSFTGARSFALGPYAKSTQLQLSSDWPHPGFEGRFPPSDRDIRDDGFSADWSVPYLRRGLPDQGRAMDMDALTYGSVGAMQVNFVSPLNPYQTVNRALKYAVLFIGLVFLAYFLMETLLSVRVHPAQYLLIGIAQAVFYLLLLAFAEHIGFTFAFIVSAVAT
ncbi:MAG: cell envelope integrity protein CreD, partial [Pseudomonadota bacterium]